jgi:hypothetical protein
VGAELFGSIAGAAFGILVSDSRRNNDAGPGEESPAGSTRRKPAGRLPSDSMPAKLQARYPAKVLAAVAAVAALSLWACVDFYGVTREYASANADRYGLGGMYERLAPVARALPDGVSVGYLSDVPVVGVRGGTAFFAARYILAPRVVMQMIAGNKPDWVLGNYSRPADYGAIASKHSLAMVQDFGQGLVLFRRLPAR